jgi:ribosomal protein S12 methylthiotransferase accessory factor
MGDWTLEYLAPFFDITSMQIGPSAHICAAVPNALAMDRWENFPSAALATSGRVATGCGIDAEACRRSGLGEAVELMKSCVWGEEARLTATIRALGPRAVHPDLINGFSAGQIRDRDRTNRYLAGYDWVPPPVQDDKPIDWMAAEDAATGAEVFVPSDAVLIGLREAGDVNAVAVADSNGCACGPTAKAAKRAALMELIERDAAARWWFGGRRGRILPISVLSAHPDLVGHVQDRARRCRLFDISSDIKLPVVAATSFEPDGTIVALGFSAKPDLASAATSAVIEMLAIETSLPPWRMVSDDLAMMTWITQTDATCAPLADFIENDVDVEQQLACGAWSLEACIEAALRCNCRVLFTDLSRGDHRSPVFRAISPELCQLRPRLGKERLAGGHYFYRRSFGGCDAKLLAPLIPL